MDTKYGALFCYVVYVRGIITAFYRAETWRAQLRLLTISYTHVWMCYVCKCNTRIKSAQITYQPENYYQSSARSLLLLLLHEPGISHREHTRLFKWRLRHRVVAQSLLASASRVSRALRSHNFMYCGERFANAHSLGHDVNEVIYDTDALRRAKAMDRASLLRCRLLLRCRWQRGLHARQWDADIHICCGAGERRLYNSFWCGFNNNRHAREIPHQASAWRRNIAYPFYLVAATPLYVSVCMFSALQNSCRTHKCERHHESRVTARWWSNWLCDVP